jgi:hypothetical protein
MSSTRIKTKWYRTGESRIVPWYFGLLRAEFGWRRDFKEPESGEVMEYQLIFRAAGRFPREFDGTGAFGFWSTLATPTDDPKFGERRFWRQFIWWFPKREKA